MSSRKALLTLAESDREWAIPVATAVEVLSVHSVDVPHDPREIAQCSLYQMKI